MTSGSVIRRTSLLCLLVILPGLMSCAGYRLGPTNGQSAGARSIQVNPFYNRTIEPRLIESLAFALRKQLQQDGTFTLETDNAGDVIVSGTILNYERHQLSLQTRDSITPRDYRITITVRLIATERATGKVIVDHKVKGYSDIRIGPDLASAERQALPLVAEDLARNATALLVDGTW
jgi:Lipopolysaccharide-assembly